MIVAIEDVNLTNVWQESFTRKDSGEVIEFHRAMLNKAGEPPMQLAVTKDDIETVSAYVGETGRALVNIDARPGERVRVYLKGFEA